MFLTVTVRPDAMPDGLPWWRIGQDVDVAMGDGEDAGRLRVACNGPYLLNRQGGHANAPTVLRVPLVVAIEPMARQAERVEYEVANGALMLALPPGWFEEGRRAA